MELKMIDEVLMELFLESVQEDGSRSALRR